MSSATVAVRADVWVTVGAACRLLEKSRTQVYRYIECGKLRSKQIGRGWLKVSLEDVNRLARDSKENRPYR